MFNAIKAFTKRFKAAPVRSTPIRRRSSLSLESMEERAMLNGTPISGVQVFEMGVTQSTVSSVPAILTTFESAINTNTKAPGSTVGTKDLIVSSAEQQIWSTTNSKLPGGFDVVYLPSVTLPTLNSSNTTLTDVINADGSVALDMQITGITGSMTVDLSPAVRLGIMAALGGPAGPGAVALTADPSYSFSANLDLKVNLPSPSALIGAWNANPNLAKFSLPASDTSMIADNIQVTGKNALATISLVLPTVKASAQANQTISVSPSIAADVNALAGGLAASLTEAYNDGANTAATPFKITNQGMMLSYTGQEAHTIYLVQNSLTPNIPKVGGTFAPVTATATYKINGQAAQSVSNGSTPTFALKTASAMGAHQITMEIDVKNVSSAILTTVTPIQVGSTWEVKFSTGQTAPLTTSNGFWAFTWPNGVKFVTSFSDLQAPNNSKYNWPLVTQSVLPPTGLQFGTRQIFLTYDTQKETLTATTSDGLKFNFTGDLYQPVTIPASNGYPAITFTVGVDFA